MDCVDISFEKDIIIQESYLIGEIIMWPKTTEYPDGFVACDGASYPYNGKYKKLYAVIQYKFGSSGNQFKVPNLNVSNTNTPILIKGDMNMNNSGNKVLNTTDNNVSGGVNTITNDILPKHNHRVNYNIDTTTSGFNAIVRQSSSTGAIYNRAFKTDVNQHISYSGGQNAANHVKLHDHEIQYGDGSDQVTKLVNDYNININHHSVSNNTIDTQKNITPTTTKIHYIIFTGVKT